MAVNIPIPSERPVRVRIAPSPTGDPHVGTAYIGLFNRVFADKHGGKFVLRIEDTDQARSTRESEQAIFDSLRWCGLRWDEGPDVGGDYGPYRQSERSEIYVKYCQELIDKGAAYYCFATPEELAEMRATAREQGRQTAYDRRYRDLPADEVQRRLDAGETHVVRLKMPIGGETVVNDGLRDPIAFDNAQIDDQVLLKSDGMPTYHLANVVDDHLMEITHVIRAEEWISSTPKHVQLYAAFGWEAPTFVHMPLLRNPDKSKISKRKNPVSLEYYQRAGILPEALINYLGRMGWSMPDESEKFSMDEMVEAFDWERLSLGGPIFDMTKLKWLNGLYIRELDDTALAARLREWLVNDDYLEQLASMYRERIESLSEFIPSSAFFFGEDFKLTTEAMLPKKREKKESYKTLKTLTEAIEGMRAWDAESIEATLKAQVAESGWKMRDVFMMVRTAITGRKATPGLYETMVVLGKAVCQARLRAGLAVLKP